MPSQATNAAGAAGTDLRARVVREFAQRYGAPPAFLAANALARGDAATAGRLLDESHASLRDDLEVSRPELDAIVRLARSHDACLGARMTGAGFGGCAVALVAADVATDFVGDIGRRYAAEIGLQPAVYVCTASRGASLETP
jgi:galactokinase